MSRRLAQQRMSLSNLKCLKSTSSASRVISAVAKLLVVLFVISNFKKSLSIFRRQNRTSSYRKAKAKKFCFRIRYVNQETSDTRVRMRLGASIIQRKLRTVCA